MSTFYLEISRFTFTISGTVYRIYSSVAITRLAETGEKLLFEGGYRATILVEGSYKIFQATQGLSYHRQGRGGENCPHQSVLPLPIGIAPNQTISINNSDIINAFATQSRILFLRRANFV